jgi:hypothetical protein
VRVPVVFQVMEVFRIPEVPVQHLVVATVVAVEALLVTEALVATPVPL